MKRMNIKRNEEYITGYSEEERADLVSETVRKIAKKGYKITDIKFYKTVNRLDYFEYHACIKFKPPIE